MVTQTEAYICLASQRSYVQKDWYRSYNSCNPAYQQGAGKTIGNLQAVNDITLKEGNALAYPLKKDTGVLLLPMVGALHFNSFMNIGGILDVGQAKIFSLPKNASLQVANPYEKELINFLLIQFDPGPEHIVHSSVDDYSFDLALTKNSLSPLHSKDETDIHMIRTFIGKFDGRKEGSHRLVNPAKGIFIFIIEGVFEVQERLLQTRDGLTLWNTDQITFEALSPGAIILVIDFP